MKKIVVIYFVVSLIMAISALATIAFFITSVYTFNVHYVRHFIVSLVLWIILSKLQNRIEKHAK